MRRTIIGVTAMLIMSGPSWAQSLRVTAATVQQSGQFADVCVSLDSAGIPIAGTQNDLVWDGGCATLEEESCQIAPDTGKQLSGRIQSSGFRYRAVVLSLDDVDPIRDGTLYCCAFRVEQSPGTCCTVELEGPGLADPFGNEVPVAAGSPAQLCVAAGEGTPLVTLTPSPTPSPIVAPTCATPADCVKHPAGDDVASASGGGGGCQTTGPRAGSAWLLVGAVILALVRRR